MSNENVSLPVTEALASALAKIEAYVPTEYVDNSEPDIDAKHLNHAEQGIMRVTNLLNAAVDVIQGQESRLADAETKIGTAALTGGMTDLSSGLNTLNSNIEMLGTRVLFENNPPYKIGNNLSEIIEKLDGWSIDMRANTFYVGIIFIGVAGYSLSGGSWNIIGCKTSNAYEWQMAIKYSENTGITVTARSKINNIWNSWGNIT